MGTWAEPQEPVPVLKEENGKRKSLGFRFCMVGGVPRRKTKIYLVICSLNRIFAD